MDFLIHRLLGVTAATAPAALVLIPLFWLLHRRWKAPGKTAAYLLFTLYLCGVYAAAGLPAVNRISFHPRLNFTFFAYMFSDYRSSLLNIFFFMPLGFLLPMIWRKFRALYRTVPFAFLSSLFIEAAQLLTPRATDVNDLITNTLGGILGYGLAMILQLIFPSLKPENESRDVYPLCLVAMATMFFVHPAICYFLY